MFSRGRIRRVFWIMAMNKNDLMMVKENTNNIKHYIVPLVLLVQRCFLERKSVTNNI